MVFSSEGVWRETPEATTAVIRVLQNVDSSPLYGTFEADDDPSSVLVAWSIVVDQSGIQTFVSDFAAETLGTDSIEPNIEQKFEFALDNLKENGQSGDYNGVVTSFIDTYLYNSIFVVLVDEFVSKDEALAFAEDQLGKTPTASNAEGRDPWLN